MFEKITFRKNYVFKASAIRPFFRTGLFCLLYSTVQDPD